VSDFSETHRNIVETGQKQKEQNKLLLLPHCYFCAFIIGGV